MGYGINSVSVRRSIVNWSWRAAVIAGLFALASCGKATQGGKQDPLPTKNVELVLFSAPWCTKCKDKHPKIQEQIKAATVYAPHIKFKLFVTTGALSNEPPTQQLAEDYNTNDLHIDGPAFADEWRWKTFRKLLPGTPMELPAAVLLDDAGNVLKAFPPGEGTFVVDDIVSTSLEATL